MKLLSTSVLLLLSILSYANSESHDTPVATPKKIGSVYLVPVFVPNQEEYREPTPLQRIVLGYTPRGAQVSLYYDKVSSLYRASDNQGRHILETVFTTDINNFRQ